ncbi:MAG: prolipoprotein diacylglyceryl transferase [Chlamydiales bacterium]|nr:prolipoprotein diacylglyceryl transferase [Chlamydiales bacterium]
MNMIGSIFFYWDPNPTAFTIPLIGRPIAWYGILFALGFFIGFYFLMSLFIRYARERTDWSEEMLKKKGRLFSERLTVYVIISTVVGARLGHVLFYEKLSHYLAHPLDIVKTWEGGLASHGGVIGILIGITLFYFRSRKEFPFLSIRRIVDLMVVPSLFVGALIRVGNFINQEVLGTASSLPWAVVFGHPIDGSPPIPRHPAQLYEALCYFGMFVLLWRLFPRLVGKAGRLSGLLFISIFTFRFFIEFVKEEQSHLMGHQLLTMGQWLSIPMILLGVFFMKRFGKEQEEEVDPKVSQGSR